MFGWSRSDMATFQRLTDKLIEQAEKEYNKKASKGHNAGGWLGTCGHTKSDCNICHNKNIMCNNCEVGEAFGKCYFIQRAKFGAKKINGMWQGYSEPY